MTGAVMAVLAGGLVWAVAGLAATPEICSTSYDPYSVSNATLQACGDQVFPLSSVTALPDGGRAYHYQLEHSQASVLVPPASFAPATASAGELSLYGLEAPATSSPEWPRWQTMVEHMHSTPAPPSEQVVLPARNGGSSPLQSAGSGTGRAPAAGSLNGELGSKNWAAYVNYASSQRYHKATAYFKEPSTSQPCTNAAESHWSGLGGVNSHSLAQAGVANYEEGIFNHYAWWEILPEGPSVIPEHATAGSWFKAETHYAGEVEGRSKFYFDFYNYADGSYWLEEVLTTNSIDLSTADYAAERPLHNGNYSPLANFGSLPFEGYTEGTALARYPYNTYSMHSAGSTVASVSGIPPSEYAFTASWHSCGKEEAK